jgi:CO/xanthine dehydrogenase FAD-binding subunit
MPEPHYIRPRNLTDAVTALADHSATIISGCTDFYPAHVGKPLPRPLLDVSAVEDMRRISVDDSAIRIGGAVTWSEIAEAPLPTTFAALQCAAKQVGSIQIQNRGTLAGNICNASPAADGIPPLLILDAEVELASQAGTRRLPLSDFILGYRKTAIEPGEILSSIVVPHMPEPARSCFVKLGARKYLVISIVMVAALLRKNENGIISEARIAVGSASEKAQRLVDLENELTGLNADTRPSTLLRTDHLSDLKPIDDVRATARYRNDAALQLVAGALDQVWDEPTC